MSCVPVFLKETAKSVFARMLGVTFLDKPQTVDLLRPYEQAFYPNSRQWLAGVRDLTEPERLLFGRHRVESLPAFVWQYEREFLARIGFQPNQIFDTRQYDVRFNRCLLGNGGHWFYPNAGDVRAIRDQLAPLIQPSTTRQRLYISRSGRRRVLNEDALTAMLVRYGFELIEDTPRTLAEQLSIYNRASVLIGPHGASFSNLI